MVGNLFHKNGKPLMKKMVYFIKSQLSTHLNQNGIAERKNRTLLNAGRSMLKTSGMASRFWEEVVATTCYLQNRTPHQGIEGQVPYTMWYGSTVYTPQQNGIAERNTAINKYGQSVAANEVQVNLQYKMVNRKVKPTHGYLVLKDSWSRIKQVALGPSLKDS